MTVPTATNGGSAGVAPPTVYFLSDYGRRDEFVGVVHAVLRRLVPVAVVVDLTHDVPPFDVRAGSEALCRTVPFLGPGVVLGVVDPGVGGGRRGLVIECAGPLRFVGPDNGLLVPAAELAGGIARAVELDVGPEAAPTFDGRDVFAPAVAALCGGAPVAELGAAVPEDELVRVPAPVCEMGRTADGRRSIRAEVTWVDHFGNVQLAVPADALPDSVREVAATPGASPAPATVPRVRTFADLAAGDVGLLADANDRLALVVREGSAALRLGVGTGDLVVLTW
ncbi:MAG: SAM hydrolase/SAM-dependent halogenase family protein [Acidimicrobiales bacterium]